MSRLKIAILFGGCSEEHDVSIKSAQEIKGHLDTEKYEPFYIGITRYGIWKLCAEPSPEWENDNCPLVVLSPDRKIHGLILWQNGKCQTQPIDMVFPVLHGQTGEDGTIQGLLELSGIPYIGCGVQSSVLCMDKSLAYMVARLAGIATPDFWVFQDNIPPPIHRSLYPIFVKPARSGSSFGVTKVEHEEELLLAIELAKQYDQKVLIERAVIGSEVGCAVLGNAPNLTVGEVDQIDLSYGFFRIHQEKKPEAGSENALITVPAPLSAEKRKKVQETGKAIYQALGCKGLARVDLFLQEDGSILLNEVNTMPGFTSYSRYPRMMAAAGISLSGVIDRLITLTLKKEE